MIVKGGGLMKKPKTDAQLITAALRKASKFSQGYIQATAQAKLAKERGKPQMYICALCNEPHEKIIRDHRVPVVDPVKGKLTWDQFINSLFVVAEEYQCVCFECHYEKTQRENQIRRENRKKK